jgi:hypothetical protein
MTEAIQFISSNSLVSTLIAAAILAGISGIIKWRRDCRDSKTIYDFLLSSITETNYTFRSTEAISSRVKISENRVADLCSKHPKIKRNAKEKQSWRIIQ